MACKRPNYTAETFKPEHVYNLASPEMPEPKEKGFEGDFGEGFPGIIVTPFEDMVFDQKSNC